jgi:hypothetical protein
VWLPAHGQPSFGLSAHNVEEAPATVIKPIPACRPTRLHEVNPSDTAEVDRLDTVTSVERLTRVVAVPVY